MQQLKAGLVDAVFYDLAILQAAAVVGQFEAGEYEYTGSLEDNTLAVAFPSTGLGRANQSVMIHAFNMHLRKYLEGMVWPVE
jgi:hypothetical protein